MADRYSYVTVDGGGSSSAGEVWAEVERGGGLVCGTWRGAGSIGWWDDEVTVLAGWPDGPPVGDDTGASGRDVVELVADPRPAAIRPFAAGGLFAHRWFEIATSDWDEFLELSTGAWPDFEAAYEATIEAFLRTPRESAAPDGTIDVLLITRYPTLAAWEESRRVEGAARERFARRRELTRRSIVRVAPLSG